jgi:hypothetical protein
MLRSPRVLPTLSRARVSLLAVLVGGLGLVGCGTSPFSSLGPQEPLLPAIEGEAKFADRFQLEEIPQFFYDLFGKELLEGNEVHQYLEVKEFDDRGNLIDGWSGQLDSNRFSIQLDHEILTEDTFRGRHAEAAIGDHLRIKPETLFPAGYVMRKTEFDGHRFDLSFAHERHLFTLLNSRVSNPIFISSVGGGGTLAPTIGRRTSTRGDTVNAFLDNARLIGFRAQGLIGDVFRVGVTFLNIRHENQQRVDNPFFGTVANTPPEVIVMSFRDDSPEDGRVGAAFKEMDVVVRYQERKFDRIDITEDPATGEPLEIPEVIFEEQESTEGPPITWTVSPADMTPSLMSGDFLNNGEAPDGTWSRALPSDNPAIQRNVGDFNDSYPNYGAWLVANGFDGFFYKLDLRNLPEGAQAQTGLSLINPATVISVEFRNVQVAGDYNIVVNGYSSGMVGDEEGNLLGMNESGLIPMPYRDVIQAPGNIAQEDTDLDRNDPEDWDPRTLESIKYGAARAATVVGVDLEGTVGNVLIRAQWSVNNKYKQYPTVSKNLIDWSLAESDTAETTTADFAVDTVSDGRTFSANDGEEFQFKPGGADNDSSETAWFVQLKHRLGRVLFEESFYHVDPGYTTTYRGWGANNDRGETYTIRRTPESTDANPFDEGDYSLIEDDDDNDDWPDSDDFDGVLPQADDRDQNGILDFQEDFLIFDADPPIFDDLVDLDNNGIIDSLEDDFEPDYEFGIDREGYHVNASWDVYDNMTLAFGWLNESEVSSARRNDSKYLQFDFQRDVAELGTLRLQNRFRVVEDDIPDYAITRRFLDIDAVAEADKLDFFNARENTTTLQLLYNAINALTVEVKYLLTLGKQSPPDEERVIFPDDPSTEDLDERIDLMVPIEQVQVRGDLREYPFYPDPNLLFDVSNWEGRRYGVSRPRDEEGALLAPEDGKTIRQQLSVFKARYEIPLKDVAGIGAFVEKIGEDLVVTPLYKYIFEVANDRGKDELFRARTKIGDFDKGTRYALNPLAVDPNAAESLEYLRFNRNSREVIEGVRLDYQFTQRVKILAGFQYRKFTNRDGDYDRYLNARGEEAIDDAPALYRPDARTRIFEMQIIQQGLWAGFNIVVLSGFRVRKDVLRNVESNTTFVRAMVGF